MGGMLTASNPCVLAMIPLMVSFVAGRKDEKGNIRKASFFSLAFIVGLAVTFTVLGVFAALAGRLYGEISSTWNGSLLPSACSWGFIFRAS